MKKLKLKRALRIWGWPEGREKGDSRDSMCALGSLVPNRRLRSWAWACRQGNL